MCACTHFYFLFFFFWGGGGWGREDAAATEHAPQFHPQHAVCVTYFKLHGRERCWRATANSRVAVDRCCVDVMALDAGGRGAEHPYRGKERRSTRSLCGLRSAAAAAAAVAAAVQKYLPTASGPLTSPLLGSSTVALLSFSALPACGPGEPHPVFLLLLFRGPETTSQALDRRKTG